MHRTRPIDVEDFHRRAVETPSHEDVSEMRSLLCDTLEDAGITPLIDDAGNVLATRGPEGSGLEVVSTDTNGASEGDDNGSSPGDSDGPHVVLNTHIDTVPPYVPYQRRSVPPGMSDTGAEMETEAVAGEDESLPHDDSTGQNGEPTGQNGEPTGQNDDRSVGPVACGRGSADAKGPLASFVAAFCSVEPAVGRVTLAITPDEETTQTGATHLRRTLDADGYVVGEPTDLDVCIGARGLFWGTVTVSGRAAHASEPASGVNAVSAAGSIMDAMDRYDDVIGIDSHDLLGAPTLTPTTIEGGETRNQVPATCRIGFDRRSVPPEEPSAFCSSLEPYLQREAPAAVDVSVSLAGEESPPMAAFATNQSDPLVEAFVSASGGETRAFGAATEASLFAESAPTVVFGPGRLADEHGGIAHADREYVHIDALYDATVAIESALSTMLS